MRRSSSKKLSHEFPLMQYRNAFDDATVSEGVQSLPIDVGKLSDRYIHSDPPRSVAQR
jgi:hypothetical protein